MMRRESLSANYLYFRFPVEYLLMVLPPIIGILAHVFSNQYLIVEIMNLELITLQMITGINSYLVAVKLSSYLLIAFFFSYRWSAMRTDGSLAFWISLGITRRRFFMQTTGKFLGLLVFGQIIGAAVVIYLNYYILDPLSIVLLALGIMSHLLFTLSIAILLSTLLDQPEISALAYLLVMVIFYFLFIDADNLVNWVLHSDLQYTSINGWLPIGIASAISLVFFAISYQLYYTMDVET